MRLFIQVGLYRTRNTDNKILMAFSKVLLALIRSRQKFLTVLMSGSTHNRFTIARALLARGLLTENYRSFHRDFLLNQCRNLELFSQNLRIRFRTADISKNNARSINTFGRGLETTKLLQNINKRIRDYGFTTGDRDVVIANAYLVGEIDRVLFRGKGNLDSLL